MIFTGYDETKKAIKLYNDVKKFYTSSCHVVFLEKENYFENKSYENSNLPANYFNDLPTENHQNTISPIPSANSSIIKIQEPLTLKQAILSEQKVHWLTATQEEINQLKAQNT